jgi:membrane protein DedA with SNARE-associated domain
MDGFDLAHIGQWLSDVSNHWWFLAVIVIVAMLDSIIPVVPSETCVIAGGVAAGLGQQELILVIACGAVGAAVGDNLAYAIGRLLADRFERRAETHERFRRRLTWASTQIHERGGFLLVTARFIPGGRTVLTLSCGITRQARGWFIAWIALAACVWATYAALLGFIGGKAFENNHTLAFVFAFAGALLVTAGVEVVRYWRKRRQSARAIDPVS